MKFVTPRRMQVSEVLKVFFPTSSRRTLQHWLKGGRFSVDQAPISRESDWIEEGQLFFSQDHFTSPQNRHLNILYADRTLVIIDKPEGLLSVPLDVPSGQMHALGLLRERYRSDQIFAVHRLDRETSGVMLFARGKEAQRRFQKLFAQHLIQREYFAVVEGLIVEERGTWTSFLRELPNYDVEPVLDPREGEQAITHFEVLHRSKKYTYLRLHLETGRKHQIRVQCKMIGCPVLGDRRYGASEDPLHRLALHAQKLGFVHPFSQKEVCFTSPLPIAFKKIFSNY
jgi:23S rRNA pseudouridine1911/1915/1917 synthase